MIQLYPADYTPSGVAINIDVDVIQEDFEHGAPSFWKA
jgi:hypothetical protein